MLGGNPPHHVDIRVVVQLNGGAEPEVLHEHLGRQRIQVAPQLRFPGGRQCQEQEDVDGHSGQRRRAPDESVATPPAQDPKRSERVPPAGAADMLHLEPGRCPGSAAAVTRDHRGLSSRGPDRGIPPGEDQGGLPRPRNARAREGCRTASGAETRAWSSSRRPPRRSGATGTSCARPGTRDRPLRQPRLHALRSTRRDLRGR